MSPGMLYVLELTVLVAVGLILAARLALLFYAYGYRLLPGWWLPPRGTG